MHQNNSLLSVKICHGPDTPSDSYTPIQAPSHPRHFHAAVTFLVARPGIEPGSLAYETWRGTIPPAYSKNTFFPRFTLF
jgi:hypothetical protein